MKSLLLVAAMITVNAATPDAAELKRMAARFAPADLKVDTSQLESGDRQALAKLELRADQRTEARQRQ